MIPAAFDYQTADSAEQAVALLAEHGDEAKILAGGHSLIPLMRFRLATPSVLVDVGGVSDLSYINAVNGEIAIGALTHHSDLEHSDVLAENCPMLAHVASLVGDPAVRHRGTLGGSLAHGDPAADLCHFVFPFGPKRSVIHDRGNDTSAVSRRIGIEPTDGSLKIAERLVDGLCAAGLECNRADALFVQAKVFGE